MSHGCTDTGTALAILKRRKQCVIAKLVTARPLGQLVLAMPYRNRRQVHTVSVPPAVLHYARSRGAVAWVVRLDQLGQCYGLPLADVEKAGWLHSSDGSPEWFVPLDRFRPLPWQEWPYVERTTVVETATPASVAGDVQQLGLFGVSS